MQSFKNYLGEDRLKKLLNWLLKYLADIDIPVKRGTFIEFRAGMLNVSPIGRNCRCVCANVRACVSSSLSLSLSLSSSPCLSLSLSHCHNLLPGFTERSLITLF